MKTTKSTQPPAAAPASSESHDPAPSLDDDAPEHRQAVNGFTVVRSPENISLAEPPGPGEPPTAQPLPPVGVTDDELRQLVLLFAQLDLFENQSNALLGHYAAIQTDAARAAYMADSSPKNFEAFKAYAINEG